MRDAQDEDILVQKGENIAEFSDAISSQAIIGVVS
jgi:hypothetical protein